MRLRFVFSEVGNGLRRNSTMALSVVLVTFVSLGFVGAAALIQMQIGDLKDDWYGKVEVTIGLCPENARSIQCAAGPITPSQQDAINAVLTEGSVSQLVEKVYFESYPGHYVTGNLFRPKRIEGRVPAILNPHGHWSYGRLENSLNASIPVRAANFARLGMIAFTYDMVGYVDSQAISHRFAIGHREGTFDREMLWGVNLLGLQLWNSIRALDFLLTLPEVDPERIGATGASGGGTQTFLLAAVDERGEAREHSARRAVW